VVIEDVEAGLVVAAGKPLLADRHTYTGGNALPEWTAGGLDARDPVILWMPRRLAVELPEAAYVVERHRGLAESLVVGVYRLGPGQVEYGPEQHRGVTVREHESVPVGPDRVLRVELHNAVPDRIDQRRERHRRAGMSRLGLLHRIYRESADCINRQLI